MNRGKDKRRRFRRTIQEIKAGLTIVQAKTARREKESERPATTEEKVKMIEMLKKIVFRPEESCGNFIQPRIRKCSYADPAEIVARIRRNAAKEAAEDEF